MTGQDGVGREARGVVRKVRAGWDAVGLGGSGLSVVGEVWEEEGMYWEVMGVRGLGSVVR